MTISEVIRMLQEVQKEHGNLDMAKFDSVNGITTMDEGDFRIYTEVDVHHGWNHLETHDKVLVV